MRDKRQSFVEKLYECNRHKKISVQAKSILKDEWMSLIKYRNEVAYEYSFNQDEVLDGINIIYKKIDDLLRIYDHTFRYCFKKIDFVKASKILYKVE